MSMLSSPIFSQAHFFFFMGVLPKTWEDVDICIPIHEVALCALVTEINLVGVAVKNAFFSNA